MKIIFVIIIVFFSIISLGQDNRGITLYGGLIANKTLCKTIRVSDQQNYPCKTGMSYSFELGSKLKYSKHFSLEIGYQRLKQHIITELNSLKVFYVNPVRHGQYEYEGMISYTDNIYLYGNHYFFGFNYELTKGKNNLNIGFSHSIIDYSNDKNYITRTYSEKPSTGNILNTNYQSHISGPLLKGININLKYERLLYKNKLGVFSKVLYQIIFRSTTFYEYAYDDLGYKSNGYYTFIDSEGNFIGNENSYSFNFNSFILDIGVFYKFNFKD